MAFILRKPGSPGQFLARKMSTDKGALQGRANNILSGNLAGEKNAPGLPVQWCEAVCVCLSGSCS
jgi:hypothetical protein